MNRNSGPEDTMNEMKNVVEIISRRIDQSEQRVCETDDNSFEIIQSEENNEKRMENNGKEWGKPM